MLKLWTDKIKPMKKLRKTIDQFILNAELQWNAVPQKRQRLLTKVFFACYLTLTVCAFMQMRLSINGKHIRTGGHINNIPAKIQTGVQPSEIFLNNCNQKSR